MRNFEALKKRVKDGGVKTIAAAAAEDAHTLEALLELSAHAKARYFLVGDKAKITQALSGLPGKLAGAEIVEAQGEEEAAAKAVSLCSGGSAEILMKGKLKTAALLKAVLNRETGIRTGALMSHIAAVECAAYGRLMFVTDGGINPHPDLSQKKAILENAVAFLHKLGITNPNAAVLAASETVSDKMPETADAAELARKNTDGEITGCFVEGPLSFDLAASKESAAIKGVDVKMAGETDIFLVPDIAAGNIMVKSLQYMGGAKMAGCVLGAKAPIVLTSRGASSEEKLLSFMLCLAAG